MNRLPLVTAALATAVAIGLWLLATYLEDESRWLPATADAPAALSGGTVAADTPVASAPLSCDIVENRLRGIVASSRACNTDRDCAVFDYGYPIDCMTSVARTEISMLRQEFSKYHDSCEYRVYFDCPTGDAQRRAVCREDSCVIDLVTVDSLRDDTLDYLGIEP